MRLRQLRTTQFITIFSPPEADQSIRDLCGLAKSESVNSSDVVAWLLEQTCRANEDLRGLYVSQGIDFCRRTDAAWSNPDFLTDVTQREKLLAVLRQPERLTLEQMYGNGESPTSSSRSVGRMSFPQLQGFMDELAQHDEVDRSGRKGAFEEVEQQREVQVQVEQVREVQRPAKFKALSFPGLHPIIADFARTGTLAAALKRDGQGFEHAFAYIAKTSVGKRFGVRETGSRLFVSTEFRRTVELAIEKTSAADNFLVCEPVGCDKY